MTDRTDRIVARLAEVNKMLKPDSIDQIAKLGPNGITIKVNDLVQNEKADLVRVINEWGIGVMRKRIEKLGKEKAELENDLWIELEGNGWASTKTKKAND